MLCLQHSFFDTQTGVLGKVFETENVSTWGWLQPPTFGFMPNALTVWAIRARHLLLLSHVFEHWLWWYRYFWSKVNIWTFEMLTVHGQQHSFSTHERVFLGKCQSFWNRKCLDLRETRTPNLWIHAECVYMCSWKWPMQMHNITKGKLSKRQKAKLNLSIYLKTWYQG